MLQSITRILTITQGLMKTLQYRIRNTNNI